LVRQRRLKRSTRRRLFRSGLYALFVIAAALVVLFVNWHDVQSNFFDGQVWKDQFPSIITTGAKNTVIYTAASFVFGFALAIVLALMKLAPVGPYRWIATTYIEFFRGLPALVVIFAVAFAVPIAFNGWRPPGGTGGQGVLALTLVYGAYMAETLRAGIQAVPKGQNEAARSLGMSAPRTMVSITLPQAFRIVVPPLTNEFVALLKDTSLLSVIGFTVGQRELTALASDNLNANANSSPLIAAALIYLVITLPLTQLVAWLERRGQRGR
jgi:polar amino acid transport system permease protein